MELMTLPQLAAVATGLSLIFIIATKSWSSTSRPAQLPPGPKPYPIVGNITEMPPVDVRECYHWLKYKDIYGPISSITIMGTTLIIVNDRDIAVELLEKRSAKYSSRPWLEFAMKLCGWENYPATQPYGSTFREGRKQMHRVLGSPSAVSRFNDLQEIEVRRFLLRTLVNSDNFIENSRTTLSAIILKVLYGYRIEPHGPDPLVRLVDEALKGVDAFEAGKWLVDMVPAIQYLPDWFPGTDFKRTARIYHRLATEAAERPYAFVKDQMAHNRESSCFVSETLRSLESQSKNGDYEKTVKFAAAGLYTGGGDTSVASLEWFFLAMSLYPEVQNLAFQELKSVTGADRLPSLSDRKVLPYIEAVYKESMRWNTIVPMGFAHSSTEEDTYREYRIPRGAIVLPNVWWFLHDPSIYHDPHSFKPERFLGSHPEPDPTTFIFGYGRRICPGRLLASNVIFLTIAQTLAVFRISKSRDQLGNEIEPETKMDMQGIAHPPPFNVIFKLRSLRHEALIRAVEREHPWEESDAKAIEELNGSL